MIYHRAYRLRIESDCLIPELPGDAAGPVDLAVRWEGAEFPAGEATWLGEWGDEGKPWFRLARLGAGYLLRFEQKADFWASADGYVVRCHAAPAAAAKLVRRLFLAEVLPCVLGFRRLGVLHASAVRLGGGGVAFAGPSGHGKSTLACHFATRGAALLTDDVLALGIEDGSLMVQPAFPGVRLWSDSFHRLVTQLDSDGVTLAEGGKFSYGAGEALPFSDEAVRLRRLYLLEPAGQGEFAIEKVAPGWLMRHLAVLQFPLGLGDEWELEWSFRTAEALARAGVCFRLSMPRDLAAIEQYADQIAGHAEGDVW